MEIKVQNLKLTANRILQIPLIEIPKNISEYEVLGWIYHVGNKKKYILLKKEDLYFRLHFFNKVYLNLQTIQHSPKPGFYTFPEVNYVVITDGLSYKSNNLISIENDSLNLEFYENIKTFIENVLTKGQIYY